MPDSDPDIRQVRDYWDANPVAAEGIAVPAEFSAVPAIPGWRGGWAETSI